MTAQLYNGNIHNQIVSCYKCGRNGHHSDQCVYGATNSSSSSFSASSSSLLSTTKYRIEIRLDGWWGKTSAYLHTESDAYKLKKMFIHELFLTKYVSDDDMDIRNQIPHLELRRKDQSQEEGETLYKTFDGKRLEITLSSFNIRESLVTLDVGMGKHLTLFYCKGLFSRLKRDLIFSLLQKILSPYKITEEKEDRKEREESDDEKEKKEEKEGENKLCRICFDSEQNILLVPCSHVCVCDQCVQRLTNCPVCRKKIESSTKVFLC